MRLDASYKPFATFSLLLFCAIGALHLSAVSRLYVVPVFIVFPAFVLIMPGQVLLILGLNGGRLVPRRGRRLTLGQKWRLILEGIRTIPPAWRIFGLVVWYVCMPVMFFWNLAASAGLPDELAQANLVAAFTVILAGFPLVHFLGFRFVLPQREAILTKVAEPV